MFLSFLFNINILSDNKVMKLFKNTGNKGKMFNISSLDINIIIDSFDETMVAG